MNENTVYIALDLGSESMAAYYEDTSGNGGMLKLQSLAEKPALAEKLSDAGKIRLDLLMEEVGGINKPSPRLWNRISFKHNAQPKDPKDDHALLCFANTPDMYDESLFRFFHSIDGWPPPLDGVMPNPKILFQQQVKDILSHIRVNATDGDTVSLHPELLIKHLTMQVLINLACRKNRRKM